MAFGSKLSAAEPLMSHFNTSEKERPKTGFRRGIEAMYTTRTVIGALDFVEDLGLQLPEQPRDDNGVVLMPVLPNDVTRLSNEQLGRLYGEFAAISIYATAHLALSDIDHTEVEYTADMTEAKFGLQAEGSNKDQRMFALKTNLYVKQGREKAMQKRARKVMLSKLIDGYEKATNTLSREMSRRGMEMEKK